MILSSPDRPTVSPVFRDAVLLILSTNNSQERLVTPLVDRLEGEITTRAMEILLTSLNIFILISNLT